jgi:outer membrane protein
MIRVALLVAFLMPYAVADAFDVLRAERNISATAAGALMPAADGCPDGVPARPLPLAVAVERSLCSNPKTRQAWADVKAQAAGVGVARAAYLPTVSANWQGMRENSVVDITDHPTLGSDYTATVRSENVSLNWLLFDFGGREAALRNANSLLEAARATQDATLQDEFATVAKDYYAAQTSIGELDAAKDVEEMTRQSMVAAQARTDRGIAPVTDALQAQTQHEQAVFSLTKAESDAQTALGTLASDMSLDPSVPLDVPPVTEGARTDATFGESVAQMIRDVQIAHPSVRAAQAQYEASLAKVSQTRAQGLPSISLVGRYSSNNQPESMGLGLPTYPAIGHEAYIGVQVNIPLFEGFGRHYQTDQAQAQAERQQDTVDEARRQVALDVWSSYQSLTGATHNARNSARLLAIAQQAWKAARHRYDAGVGNILELMNTQAALANAKQRRIQALAEWDNARVDLAAKLGRLGPSDLD